VVLYELATGVLPFRGASTAATLDAILHAAPVPPVRLNPDVPAELERIILKALEKDKQLRYQHASEIAADLQRLKRDSDSGATPARGTTAATAPARSRGKRWLWAGIAAAAVLALAARSPEDTRLHARGLGWIRAATELARGRGQEAIEHLAASKPHDRGEITSQYLRGLAHLQLRSASEALPALQTIIERPQIDQFAIEHPLARLGKARAAALSGDLPTARTAYQDFLAWWKDADPDLPVLVAVRTEYEKVK
jgi:hypothetical protein